MAATMPATLASIARLPADPAPADCPDAANAADPAALETELLLEALYRRFGHDFRAYDRATVQRRLGALMQARSLATVSALQEQLLHRADTAPALLRALAGEPAGLFDDPVFACELRAILAELGASPLPRIWLAECAGAGQAWTLAILLAEQGLIGRTEIYATVANEELLLEMREASVPVQDLAQWQQVYLDSGGSGALADHFDVHDGRARLCAALRERITWAQYSLVTDASFNEFQAILCSRALLDFGPALRQRVLRLFHDSLARFGILAIDQRLAHDDAYAARYQAIGTRRHWYRRTA